MRIALALGMCLALQGSTQAAMVYFDDFSGSASPLSGTAPDIRPGSEIWTGGSQILANGTKTGTQSGTAFLPFSPVAGNLYTLSMDVTPTAGGSDWFAIGFTGTTITTPASLAGGLNAVGWVLYRSDETSTSAFQTFLGPNLGGPANFDPSPDINPSVNLRVDLDTNPALWTVTWYADDNEILATTAFATNPTINFVALSGIATIQGSFDNFTLSVTDVPEPSTFVLLALGAVGAGIAIRRRRAKAKLAA